MKHLEEIVLEEINKFLHEMTLNESLIGENDLEEARKKKKKRKKKSKQNSKKKKPLSDKQRAAEKRIKHANARDGKKVSSVAAQNVRDFLNDPSVNVSDVMVQATGLAPTSASSLGSKIAKGKRPVKAKLAQTVHNIQAQLA